MQQLTLEYILDKSTPLIFDEKNQQVNIWKHSFRIEVVTIILKMKVTIWKIERNEESIEIHWKIPFYSWKIEITKNEIKRILNLYNEYGSYKWVENVNWFDVEVTITKCY
jgi:superfamily I DNA/RNA helicase